MLIFADFRENIVIEFDITGSYILNMISFVNFQKIFLVNMVLLIKKCKKCRKKVKIAKKTTKICLFLLIFSRKNHRNLILPIVFHIY